MRNLFDNTILSIFRCIISYVSARNILYIKVLQWTFKESIFLPSNVNQYLNSFRDSAPFTENDIDITLIQNLRHIAAENGDELHINMTPINSGTISVVFEGSINESPIVVKMKRKNIEQSFLNVRSTLLSLASMLNFMTGNDYTHIIEKLADSLEEQLDFKREFDNIQLFYKASKRYKLMDPIYAIEKYSSDNLITMSRAPGVNPETLDEEHFLKFKLCYLKSLFFLFFKKSIIHSDIHYGNLLYNSTTNKMAFIDLGQIIKMTPDQSSCFQEMTIIATTEPDRFGDMVSMNAHIYTKDGDNKDKLIEFVDGYTFKFNDNLPDKLIEISKFMMNLLGKPIVYIDIFPSIIVMIMSIIRISADIDGTDDMIKILNMTRCS